MKTNKIVMIVAVAAIAFSACKKDDDDSSTKSEMILGNWSPTDILLNGTSLWELMDDCDKDDTYTFKADGSTLYDQGAQKCDPDDDQTEIDVYKLLENDTKILFEGDTLDILTLTNSVLKVGGSEQGFASELHFKKN